MHLVSFAICDSASETFISAVFFLRQTIHYVTSAVFIFYFFDIVYFVSTYGGNLLIDAINKLHPEQIVKICFPL